MVEAEKIGIATIINYQKCIFANKVWLIRIRFYYYFFLVKLEELFC